ncbi:MAG: asparagine synthase (glutamine-hydrolyzing) [candidate division KSB1 bacterium]
MCGITGFIETKRERSNDELHALVTRMATAIQHRGPDDAGDWCDAEAGVALGHRRLSIIDLSPLGHQPMFSADGRFVLIFNGEVYNFRALRVELESLGHKFRGHSDTEVMLAAFVQWSVKAALQRFNGMFAFALWDRRERCLLLARDRMGEKPLYYGLQGSTFLFGSELKALRAHPSFRNEINRDALTLFLRYSYIPAPFSIYNGIQKLPAAALLKLDCSQTQITLPEPEPYWSLREAAQNGVAQASSLHGSQAGSLRYDATAAIAQFEELLREAVKLRMEADVPLGAFLSGGMDSSTIVALMQAQSTRPVKTFTIGFHEHGYNEAEHAKAVAQHLGTEHTELYVTPEEMRAVIPRLPMLYDEPFADSSQLPTFLVAQLARRHVTVSLSGDGGDELFAGYKHYQAGQKIWSTIKWLPRPARQALARAIQSVPTSAWSASFGWMKSTMAKYGRPGEVGDKMHKVAEVLANASEANFYQMLSSHWKTPEQIVINGREPRAAFLDPQWQIELPSLMHHMMFSDAAIYLPDDILVKVDRASMAVSLESRVPLLDHRVVEFAWQVPLSMKLHEGKTKWLLRQVLYKYVTPALIEREKMGFGVPIHQWLRGPLREWAEALLHPQRMQREGFLRSELIQQKWQEHQRGEHDWQYYLWDVLMFQAWLEEWGRK